MPRATSVLLATVFLLALAAPLVQADHSSTTCSDTELHILGTHPGCTRNGLYIDPANDSRNTVEIATLDEGATFSGKIKITFSSPNHTDTLTVGMIAGTIQSASGLNLQADEYDVTVDILSYGYIDPTGNWQVTINYHEQ